ncbi:MAG: copper-containing nitrite reductase [Spirochaetia bacterium]|jgi:nitrite reductase (NO-forming)
MTYLGRVVIVASLVLLAGIPGGTAWAESPARARAYTLRTDMTPTGMAFFSAEDSDSDLQNPTLVAEVGDTVTITLVNGDGAVHDVVIEELHAASDTVKGKGNRVTLTFTADRPGVFAYYCDIPGHREAGMEGKLVVKGSEAEGTALQPPAAHQSMSMPQPAPAQAVTDIVRNPADLPGPLPRRGPAHVRIELEAREVVGQLAAGTTFRYWTFNGKVPGPFFRVRLGDTVEVTFRNEASSSMSHSVDFHAVTGPGGGAVMTNTPPGGETHFSFLALHPGLFVYHCATPMVAEHIANGMYGLILVEPAAGLRPADREFYVMQGEIYTRGAYGDKGMQEPDTRKLLDERPEYFVFNGAVGGLTETAPLRAKVGQSVRIFFGDGGPNATSSLHLIGEIFDRLYQLGSVSAPPLTDVQTASVPPGGAAIAELSLRVPGKFILVDHALSRMQRGLSGWLIVDGAARPDIYDGVMQPGSGH